MIIKASCPFFPFHSYSCIVLPFYSFQDEQSKICKYMPFPYLKSSNGFLSHSEEYIQLYSLCCGLHSPWPMFLGLFLWPHSVALTFIFKLKLHSGLLFFFSYNKDIPTSETLHSVFATFSELSSFRYQLKCHLLIEPFTENFIFNGFNQNSILINWWISLS